MKKSEAINILEDIQNSLNRNDMERAKKNITIYQKNIEITTNEKIKKLIPQYIEYKQQYGENGRKTVQLGKKIDKEIIKINKKYKD